MRFRIALAQFSASEKKEKNLERALQLIDQAKEAGAALLVLPELFMEYVPFDELSSTMVETAEDVDGPFIKALSTRARSKHIHVAVGIIEKSPKKDKVYNTIVMLGPTGKVLSTHRKLQLFDSFGYKESSRFEPASDLEGAFKTGLGKLGMMTCYELRFPEIARILARQGAQLILVPTDWVAGRMKEEHLLVLAKARALENTVFVAVAAQTGRVFTGRSMVADPFGVTICDAGEEEVLVTAEIDLERVRRVRRSLPNLSQVRNDVYRRHLD